MIEYVLNYIPTRLDNVHHTHARLPQKKEILIYAITL